MGCDMLQGRHFGKPVSAADIAALLARGVEGEQLSSASVRRLSSTPCGRTVPCGVQEPSGI